MLREEVLRIPHKIGAFDDPQGRRRLRSVTGLRPLRSPLVQVQPGKLGPCGKVWTFMNVLLVGTGTVGEAIAHLVKGRKWLTKMTLADYSLDRARTVADAVGAVMTWRRLTRGMRSSSRS